MADYTGTLRITTPEGLTVDLALAGIGSRFMATLLDVLIQGVIAVVGALALVAVFDGGVLTLLLSVGAFLVLFGFDVLFELRNDGRTPGKQATGLRVVRADGTPVTLAASATRNIMRLVDFLPSLYGVAMLTVFLTRNQQRLGDLAAGTLVIRDRTANQAARLPDYREYPGLNQPARPVDWDVSAVTREDLVLVRAFLARRPTLTPEARVSLAADLSARLRPKVAGAPESDPERFLEALVGGR